MSNATIQPENQTAGRVARENEIWVAPEVDICETKTEYTIYAEMPGVNKESLLVTVEGNELLIEGRRGLVGGPGQRLHREIRTANYRRAFELDPAIDPGKISAKMDQGLLVLKLPKTERAHPRKINVVG